MTIATRKAIEAAETNLRDVALLLDEGKLRLSGPGLSAVAAQRYATLCRERASALRAALDDDPTPVDAYSTDTGLDTLGGE